MSSPHEINGKIDGSVLKNCISKQETCPCLGSIPGFFWVDDKTIGASQGFTFAYIEKTSTPSTVKIIIFSYNIDGHFDCRKAMKWVEYLSRKRKIESENTQLEYNVPNCTFYVQEKCLKTICSIKPLMKDDIFLSIVKGYNNKIDEETQNTFFNFYKVDNCINLLTIAPSSVLLTLRLRYFASPKPLVYTFAGSVLLCINPFSQEPYNFNAAQIFKNETTNIFELPPHPFTISEKCFRRLCVNSVKQTIIISGDSGAGKTETAKLLMNYLAARNYICSADPNEDIYTCHDEIYQKLSRMNPILECFGNAVTCRNNNSSRFGRLNKLYFRNGILKGSGVKTYLLERSRITHPDNDERNFHIFYALLKGGDQTLLRDLGLTSDGKVYNILPNFNGVTYGISYDTDKNNFNLLEKSLLAHDFTSCEIIDIYRIVAGILHLSRLTQSDLETFEMLKENDVMNIATTVLGIPLNDFASLICTRKICRGGDMTPRPLCARVAMTRTIMRWLYYKLFEDIIVKKLNAITPQENQHISILDIYGFECMPNNSFEQLLINLANEKLQQFFVHHLIVAEQEKYCDEQINWKPIKVKTGNKVIQCITGKGVPAVLPYLVDVGRLASSDLTEAEKSHELLFYKKLGTVHEAHKDICFLDSTGKTGDMYFSIHHFAGTVTYDVNGWLLKDNDKVDPEVYKCMMKSNNTHVRHFASLSQEKETGFGRFTPISQRFVSDVDRLLLDMSKTDISFIRCFSPNEKQKSHCFDGSYVLRQMEQSGTIELLHVCQSGYSFHHHYTTLHRPFQNLLWHVLFSKTSHTCENFPLLNSAKHLVNTFLYVFIPEQRDLWEMGLSMLFARHPLSENLSQLIHVNISSHPHAEKILSNFQWRTPSYTSFLEIYHSLALRPWRSILRPIVMVLKIFRTARFYCVDKAVKYIPQKLYFAYWKEFIQANKKLLQPIYEHSPQAVSVDTKYVSPWFFTWRHKMFLIPSTTSTLFFDGSNLWIVDNDKESHAKRLFFYQLYNLKNTTQRLCGPTVKKLFLKNAASPQEDFVLGICQHPQKKSLYSVITKRNCLYFFTLVSSLETKKGTSTGKTFHGCYHKKKKDRKRCLDMRQVFIRLFQNHPLVDIHSLHFLQLFFPFNNNENIIITLWSFHRKSQWKAIPKEFLILMIDTFSNGHVNSLFYGKLPSLHVVHNSIQLVGPKRWTLAFPCYADISIRPSYKALLENSICVPLVSNRGFIWAGAGFLKLFGFSHIFNMTERAVNIQLHWDSEAILHPRPFQNHSEKTLRNTWNYWIFNAIHLPLQKQFITEQSHDAHVYKTCDNLNTTDHVTPRNSSVADSFEKILLTSLRGDMLVLSLSLVNTCLKCDYIKPFQGFHHRHGLLHVHHLSGNEWTISLLRITNSGSLEHLILKNLLEMSYEDNSNLNITPNFHVEHTMTNPAKFTCVQFYNVDQKIHCTAADLVSGMIKTWSLTVSPSFNIIYKCGTALRYSRHQQIEDVFCKKMS
ncbi:uncharacterized protein LOC128883405 isoform X3 [Hylaeus volcanicus]|uniref:uncharacterized protein LOC128883405 isoform X3 n=1 Tax=Hylaeus volcanicus TaxID=313075 RepID=UPI0023B7EA99|nr:uncharacterized protein LOC128883405 isoform X3 [Hylaeus volcanicus]